MTSDERTEYLLALDASVIEDKTLNAYDKRQLALYVILGFILKNTMEFPPGVLAAARLLIPKRIAITGRAPSKESANEIIARLFNKKPIWTADQLSTEGYGTSEMVRLIKKALEMASPPARFWIEFDPVNRNFSLLAKGSRVPKNYTGFVPKE